MKLFLAGGESRHFVLTERLNEETAQNIGKIDTAWKPYILESFFYANDDTEKILPLLGDFLIDSGAFTFMQGKHNGRIIWEEYCDRYADFIKRNNIRKYFELDIDSVVGYGTVKVLRKRLSDRVGWQPIPVWHTSRGKDEFVRMTEEFPYVAIGGLVNTGKGEYARKYWNAFPWFIRTAHDNGAKIHALGFTSLDGITRYHFDSVDSTAWTVGNRCGFLYRFNGKTMTKVETPKGKKFSDTRTVALLNFNEWVKFQRYADKYL